MISPKHIVALGLILFVALFGLCGVGRLVENVDAKDIMVVQDPFDGELHFHTTAGVKSQSFGSITKYEKSQQFSFELDETEGKESQGNAIKVRFRDGGEGYISGSVRYELPLDEVHLKELHTKYGSQEAIERAMIRPVLEKSVYMSGPMMSSTESYSARRNELIGLIMDQAQNGVYRTRAFDTMELDPLSGEEKTVQRVEILKDATGGFARQEVSPLITFGIRLFNLTINRLPYNETVEGQIKQQQAANAQVQTAIAKAREAEQAAITAEKQGQAEAAKAKWDQEVIKARLVTEAEQRREVARLDKEAAEFTKAEQILLGEGEAERKRLVLNADGALAIKTETAIEINKVWADAFARRNVPQFVTGGSVGGQDSETLNFMNLLTAKTMKDLALDMTVPAGRVSSPDSLRDKIRKEAGK